MKEIQLIASQGIKIRFRLYTKQAPITCESFLAALPFRSEGVQARFAGKEIWIPKGPALRIPQENATVCLKLGEIGYAAPLARSEVSRSIAIVYGEATLGDCVNVFGRVLQKDLGKFKTLGEKIWRGGARMLKFEKIA